MDLNDKLQAYLHDHGVSAKSVIAIVAGIAKKPALARMPLMEAATEIGGGLTLVGAYSVFMTCTTIFFLTFWVGNQIVKYTEQNHLPLPLDVIGISRAARWAGVPSLNAAVAMLVQRNLTEIVGARPSPEELKRAFGRQA